MDPLEVQRKVFDNEVLERSRNPRHAAMLSETVAGLLASCPQGRVLDLGGYSGDYTAGRKAVVFDLSWNALKEAKRRGLPAVQGDFHHLPFKPRAFAAVVACHVLEHSPDPSGVLREIGALLPEGGALALLLPNAAGAGQIWKLLAHGDVKPAGNRPGEPPQHLHQYTRRNLEPLLAAAAFRVSRWAGDCVFFPGVFRWRAYGLARLMGRLLPSRAESLAVLCRKAR